jgi:hypothetical protein
MGKKRIDLFWTSAVRLQTTKSADPQNRSALQSGSFAAAIQGPLSWPFGDGVDGFAEQHVRGLHPGLG